MAKFDVEGTELLQVAENEEFVFMVPVERKDDMRILHYDKVRTYAKDEPYMPPVTRVEKFD
jgi:hypothetical protein